MKLLIEMDLDNAAFEDDPVAEIESVLQRATQGTLQTKWYPEARAVSGVLMDSNGNKVGKWIRDPS